MWERKREKVEEKTEKKSAKHKRKIDKNGKTGLFFNQKKCFWCRTHSEKLSLGNNINRDTFGENIKEVVLFSHKILADIGTSWLH